MISRQVFGPSDWNSIELVAFDVDGTLYDQRALRLRIARDMFIHVLLQRDPSVLSVIGTYRRIRERLGDEEVEDFEMPLIARTVNETGCSAKKILAIVTEWIEQRPIRYLTNCRYSGVIELFAGLKRSSKLIGVYSDYPAREKLAALGLAADFVVSAGDAAVRLLKPNPRGLEFLIKEAGATAGTTMLIGDRGERDGVAAMRAGARCLIRSSKPDQNWQTFSRYDDPLFTPLLLA